MRKKVETYKVYKIKKRHIRALRLRGEYLISLKLSLNALYVKKITEVSDKAHSQKYVAPL